jgi:hypothetical protein
VLRKAELSSEADSENNLGGCSETICITSDWMFTRRLVELPVSVSDPLILNNP